MFNVGTHFIILVYKESKEFACDKSFDKKWLNIIQYLCHVPDSS